MTKNIWLAEADKTLLRRAKGLLAAAAKEAWPAVLSIEDVRLVIDAVATTAGSAGDGTEHALEEVPESDIQLLWLMGACRDESGAPQLGPDGRLACPPWSLQSQRGGGAAGVPVGSKQPPEQAAAPEEEPKKGRRSTGPLKKAGTFVRRIPGELITKMRRENYPTQPDSLYDRMHRAQKEHKLMTDELPVQETYLKDLENDADERRTRPLTSQEMNRQAALPAHMRRNEGQRREKHLKETRLYVDRTKEQIKIAKGLKEEAEKKYVGDVATRETDQILAEAQKEYEKTAKEFEAFARSLTSGENKRSIETAAVESALEIVGAREIMEKEDQQLVEKKAREAAQAAYRKIAKKYWQQHGLMQPVVALDLGMEKSSAAPPAGRAAASLRARAGQAIGQAAQAVGTRAGAASRKVMEWAARRAPLEPSDDFHSAESPDDDFQSAVR